MEISGVKIYGVKDLYPAGYERSLIQSVLGIDVPDGSIPARLGILVINIQTLLAVYEAVSMDKKADSKYITVSDLKNGTAKAVRVTLGSRVADTIESVYPGSYPVFTGGGIMQSHIAEDDEPVGKNTNFITVSSMPRYKASPFCSNCGSCRTNCPKGLAVNRIAELTELGRFDEIKRYQPERCIKCGLCSYVCLAGKNLSARVSEAKEKVLL
jgi:Na+-translocating ferredoxin:NAD+ oxidoreductase RnfC subunit